jgi:nucleosome binding factor SPN SPT16 subunit
VIQDPSKIGVKVSPETVDSCYFPIIQSGGVYDIRISGQSNGDYLSPDVIVASLGAKYKDYCAHLSRTFMVDAPKKVETTYSLLMATYDACLEQMSIGNEFKDVLQGARNFLSTRNSALLAHLPKTLGFAIGIQFRDSSLILNDKNTTKFVENMIIALTVGFHNVALEEEDKKGSGEALKKMNVFSLLLADTVRIQKDSTPEILTKASKEFGDVSYSISENKVGYTIHNAAVD